MWVTPFLFGLIKLANDLLKCDFRITEIREGLPTPDTNVQEQIKKTEITKRMKIREAVPSLSR